MALGEIRHTVSLADLVGTGDAYQIYLMNYGRIGSAEYELIVQAEPQLAEKIRLGRLKRKANSSDPLRQLIPSGEVSGQQLDHLKIADGIGE
jgi:hypothetical protein